MRFHLRILLKTIYKLITWFICYYCSWDIPYIFKIKNNIFGFKIKIFKVLKVRPAAELILLYIRSLGNIDKWVQTDSV